MNFATINRLSESFKLKKTEALANYETFLRFQSISSEPAFKNQVLACADWVIDFLSTIGFEVELWPTTGHPTIFAKYEKAGPQQPTLLIYNHYDVQPVDPLDLWHSPPFEPTVRGGQVYARGAQDNKGQCFYVLWALKTLIELHGTLPINIKLCIEGEEECGSTGLSEILPTKRNELQADYLAIVDVGIPKIDIPAITLGVRGIVTMDLEVRGSNTDLHSGSHGGIAFNPIHALLRLLGSIRDSSGKILIPGFYDDIVSPTKEKKQQLALKFDVKDYEKMFDTKATGGEKHYDPIERNWLRPTFEVNGISGGYTGEGFKTVIPAKAFAKISCRLVPNQDPLKVAHLVKECLESHAPEGTKVTVTIHKGSGKALHADIHSKIVQVFKKAYEEVFNAPCEFHLCGASIPIVTELTETSGAEVVLVGLGLPSDCIHAPNEHFGLDRIEKGFLIIARTIELLKK